jgi:hypothetical protein
MPMEKKKLILKFKTEAEEADWLYDHRDEIDHEWVTVTDKTGKPLTPAEIRDLERARTREDASERGG